MSTEGRPPYLKLELWNFILVIESVIAISCVMVLFHAQKSLRYDYEAHNDLNLLFEKSYFTSYESIASCRPVLFSVFPFFTNFPSIDLFSLCIYGEVWRHVTVVAKFLDRLF